MTFCRDTNEMCLCGLEKGHAGKHKCVIDGREWAAALDSEHQCLRDAMARIARAVGYGDAFVLEMTCKEGETPADKVVLEVRRYVAAARSLPDTFVERAIQVALKRQPGEDSHVGLTAIEASSIRNGYASRNPPKEGT